VNLPSTQVSRAATFLKAQKPFFWVLAAWFACFLYYGLVASDRYATEVQVYVRSVKMQPTTELSALTALTGGVGTTTDIALLQSYLHSHDLLRILDEKIGLKVHYQSGDADFLSRLSSWATEEDFLAYYRDHVGLEIDEQSGILSVRAQAFTPEYSLILTEQLLAEGEAFINRVGQEIAIKEIRFIEGELDRAREELQARQRDLLEFQSKYQMLSPQAEGEAFQQVMSSMRADLVRLKAEEKVLTSYLNEKAPEVVSVRARIAAIEEQLAVEQGKLNPTGADTKTLGEVNLDYKELELRLEFATQVYTSAFATLEQTRVDAYRKLKHLVVVQAPSLPDEAAYPRRGYMLVTIFVFLTLAYAITALIVATVREHRDV
jgi:capsular polysaccharide transport system permease protein